MPMRPGCRRVPVSRVGPGASSREARSRHPRRADRGSGAARALRDGPRHLLRPSRPRRARARARALACSSSSARPWRRSARTRTCGSAWSARRRPSASCQHSIVQIPEIAQRLYAMRELREIPDSTLDLVQEIFQPSYSVFYRMSNGKLVAVACRGESEFRLGHRLELGEGVVGWTASKQLPFTPEDAELESAQVRSAQSLALSAAQGLLALRSDHGAGATGRRGADRAFRPAPAARPRDRAHARADLVGGDREHGGAQQGAPAREDRRAHGPHQQDQRLPPPARPRQRRHEGAALDLPARHRPLQAIQRHERPPAGRRAAEAHGRGAAGEQPRARGGRALRRRGIPGRHAEHAEGRRAARGGAHPLAGGGHAVRATPRRSRPAT